MGYRIGVDIGGLVDPSSGRFLLGKELTTPDDPSRAVEAVLADALRRAGASAADVDRLVHGTTLVTNAVIERKGARTALLTSTGFRDSIEIGRENREVCPEIREYERTWTTIANAYVLPRMGGYLGQLEADLRKEGIAGPLLLMMSSGGITTVDTARRYPVRLVESGPAGGAILSTWAARPPSWRWSTTANRWSPTASRRPARSASCAAPACRSRSRPSS